MSKWTQGKWEVFDNADDTGIVCEYAMIGVRAAAVNADIAFCHGFDTGRDRDEELANARLIAAAPQLVEALGSLLGWAVMRSDWAAAGKSEPTDHPIQRARAALKAAGVSHE